MRIVLDFKVDERNSDPTKLIDTFDQYVRDMLYVGVDAEDNDPFWIEDFSVVRWLTEVDDNA